MYVKYIILFRKIADPTFEAGRTKNYVLQMIPYELFSIIKISN